MYDPTDPRASLQPAAQAAKPSGPFRGQQACDFSTNDPTETGESYQSWHWRAQNVLLHCVELDGTITVARHAQIDEFVVFALDDISLEITTQDGTETVAGNHLCIVPHGDSVITAKGQGTLTFLYSLRNADIAALCPNNTAYAEADPRIPAFQPWPDPVGGFKLRSYDLNVPAEEGRFGRIFRCTTMMVNVLDPRMGPRDPSKMSPHHHDDFEQISLALKGAFSHLMRWPWTSNKHHWREDISVDLGAPSACVIPPPCIHTSLSTGEGENQLIDIFAPPRVDFSLKPGWVLNADDYPMPAFVKG